MLSERLEGLLRTKVIQGKISKKTGERLIVANSHFNYYWDRLRRGKSHIEKYPGNTRQEKIYRFLMDDKKPHICKLGGCDGETKFKTFKKGFDEYCSVQCVREAARLSGNFTTNGYSHSKKTKEKMSRNHARLSGDENPFRKSIMSSPIKRKEHSDRKRKWWGGLTDSKLKEIKEIFSKGQANADHHEKYKWHKSGHFKSKKMGRSFYYRSSWEYIVCVHLESNHNVSYFTLEEMYLPYVNKNGENRYTRIDFLIKTIDGRCIIFEVKPLSLLTYRDNINKIIGIQEYCVDNKYEFYLVYKERLNSIGSIINGEIQNEATAKFI